MSPQNLIKLKEILIKVAYQMLGSSHDAEDIVQDVLTDIIENTESVKLNHIQNPTGYYVRTTINKSLNLIKRQQRDNYKGVWLPIPLINTQTKPEINIDVSYAFVHILSKLNPKERAVFILRESFDMNYKEISHALGLKESNCRKLFERSKSKINKPTEKELVDLEKRKTLIINFLEAANSGNIDSLVKLLNKEIIIYSDGGGKVPSAIKPIFGVDHCIKFILGTQKLTPQNISWEYKKTDQDIFFLFYENNNKTPFTVITAKEVNSKIDTIFILRNPDKLLFL